MAVAEDLRMKMVVTKFPAEEDHHVSYLLLCMHFHCTLAM